MSIKNSALCLFDDADVQMDITRTIRVEYYPIHNITAGAPIEFKVGGTPDEYVDLGDIRLTMRVKLLKKDKKTWDATDDVAFINQAISSCFQDVFLKIADTQVEGGQHLYPYNATSIACFSFIRLPKGRIWKLGAGIKIHPESFPI